MTPIERLSAWLDAVREGGGEQTTLSVPLKDGSPLPLTYSDLRVVLNDARGDARQATQLGDMYRHAIERAKDRDEWKRKAEALEAERDALMSQLRNSENSESLHEGRAHAFLEALKLVCGVRE